MQTRRVVIVNALGLHARAAARFVTLAGQFPCRIHVHREGRIADGTSILALLALAASHGREVDISADGPDEGDAVEALTALVKRGFEETPS